MDAATHGGDLGVHLIDRDHHEIAQLIAAINFEATSDAGPGSQVRHLKELERMVRSHFILEEAMMTASRYPGAIVHAMRHKWMLEQIRRLSADWKSETGARIREPMTLVWESHLAHIVSEDRDFGRWLYGPRIVPAPD